MPKPMPVCVACGLFFKPKKNGFAWVEGMPTVLVNGDEEWKPYKLWLGDLLACAGCGTEIIAGHGREPISIHHEPNFEPRLKAFNPSVIVNDC